MYTWLDLGIKVFWRKGENSLLNVEEFCGGSGEGNRVDLSALKTFRLRHSFVQCILVLQYLHEFFHDTNFGLVCVNFSKIK